ncbi:MAG: retropepsin-like domain-containing protein [Melioribacteraceae bacterium]|nr:retropepsin-like domain-containing protein [Melioribacteraceae bacterium]
MSFRIIAALFLLIFILLTISCNEEHHQEKLPFDESTLTALNTGDLRFAITRIDSLMRAHPENKYLKYFYGTILVNYGSEKVFDLIDTLKSSGDTVYSGLLELHIDVMIGDLGAKEKLERKLKEFPNNNELKLLEWIVRLDEGEFEYAENSLNEIRATTPLKYLPLLAMYYHSYDRDYKTALKYLSMLRDESIYRKEKDFNRLSFLQNRTIHYGFDSSFTVKYEQCGAQPGMQFVAENGIILKMGFDTGTNGYGFTIHRKSLGDSLKGPQLYNIEKGIQYNYMSEPADVTGKLVNFKIPYIENFLVEYFDGGLTIADGVFSPLLFNAAVTINSKDEIVMIHNKESLEKYITGLEQGEYTTVPYKVRKGWMFIPCEVKGKKVEMIIEAGSRDVNFNALAVKRLGIETYESSLKWRGKDYPVTKLDTEIKIGNFTYTVAGGLKSKFVLGNLGCGLACAGDIGPDFIRNYIFTIDSFNRQIILEKH